MVDAKSEKVTYTIKEAAKLSGLPESTLRYYEKIGIINPIIRDVSSKHRVYSDDDLNIITAIACLNATGLSLSEMKSYLSNLALGEKAAPEQLKLLIIQKQRLEEESRYLELRKQYVDLKIDYWQAVSKKDLKASDIGARAKLIAARLKSHKDNI